MCGSVDDDIYFTSIDVCLFILSDSIHIVRLPLHEISTCTDAQKSLPRARRIGQRVVTDHYVMLGHEQQSQNNVMPIL